MRGAKLSFAVLTPRLLRDAAVAGDAQAVRLGIEVREAALVHEADERRVVLVAQAEVEGQLRRDLPLVVDEREDRPVLRAGIGHLEVARDAARARSSRKLAKALA